MLARSILGVVLGAVALSAETKTKMYAEPDTCLKTYHLAAGRVLTSRGLIEDPTVNAIMKDAVALQMRRLNINEASGNPDAEIRFVGGSGAGLQVDDMAVGDVAMWNVGGTYAINGRTYKKSSLIMVVVESRSNRTLWAARCTDNFGDPDRIQERIEQAVAKAFSKFPKKLTCDSRL